MPKYGGGSDDYTLFPTELDPLKFTPNFGDTAGAAFREASQYTIGRQAIDRSWMEAGWSPLGSSDDQKQFMSIQEANQKYGLNLKPTYAKRISVGLAEYFQRKQIQSQMDQAVLQQAPPDPVTGFAAGIGASFTDPAELGINALLMESGTPLTNLAKSAQLSAEAGELVRPSVAARFFARYPGRTALSNPLISGAVEGAGSVALMSPLTYFNSQALGRKYTLEDALTSIAASGVVGAGLGGVHGLLNRGLGKIRPVVSEHGAPVDPMLAHLSAEVDMNNGRPVDVGRSVDVAARTKELADARAEIEQTILRSQESDPATVKDSLPVEPQTDTILQPQTAPAFDHTEIPDLPNNLKRSAPRFKTSVLQFDSELDKALYIIGKSEGKSKAHDQFVDYVKQVLPELDNTEIDTLARRVRQDIVDQAKAGDTAIGEKASRRLQELYGERPPIEITRPKMEPVEITNPEAVRHTTPLEQKLLAVTDPEGFRSVLQSHLSDLNLSIAKLGELVHLPEAERLDAHEDIQLLQNEILAKFANLNEILPSSEKGLPTEVKTTNKGVITKKSLQTIGKEVSRLNDLAVREMDEPSRLASLQTEHSKIAAELKKALAKLKEGEAKGWSTVDTWREKVAELTPQLEHATRLLQAHGAEVNMDVLPLSHYIDSLGENLPSALKGFVDTNPGKLQEPLYRVRNGIFDAIRARMDQTQKYLQDLDYTQPVRKFPEDDEILRELNHFMETEGQTTLDPTAIHEEAAKVIDQQISEYKSLGIFDDKSVERFENIKKQFDEQLQKTDAVKKGSLQAQICALGGVTEDE